MASAPLPPADHLRHLDRAAGAFAAVLDTGDLAAPVPGCPGWSLTDLAHHLGGIHRWARTAVVEGRPGEETVPGAPTDRAGLRGWFRDGADSLLATLRATAADAPCWTFGPRPRQAGFWFRRQAHETALHAWDAQSSQGDPAELPVDLATDGVDEVLGVFVPRQLRLGRMPPLPAVLALDVPGGHWRLGDGAPDATVRGPAGAVLLLLWQRTTLDDPRLELTGDRRAAEAVLAGPLAP